MPSPRAFVVASVLFAGLAPAASPAGAAPAPRAAARPAAASADTAFFAGGCFWCMEAQFEGVPGVLSVVSGYTGGHRANPTYEEVCAHETGHYEAVRIAFDPTVTSYAALLERFWHGVDPTQADGQFCDLGESYRTAIFYRDETQRRTALDSRAALKKSGRLRGVVVTEVRPAKTFWVAEDYHQDFYRKQPERYRAYRQSCLRDRRLKALWGEKAVQSQGH
jgi:peptide-methionine (S)-S-oxide reductase